MARILNIETTTTNCSVSLGEDGEVVGVKENNSSKYSHAESLHVFISQLLKEHQWEVSDLDAIAVSMGPGSYTGLRIGVSTAKGLSYAQEVPLIGISTLRVLSLQVDKEVDYIVPMLDARRMEVYTAVYDAQGTEIAEVRALILDENSFSDLLSKARVAFIGDGVAKFEELCKHPNAIMIHGKLPSARNMVGLSQQKYKTQSFEDVAYFEPYYLKEFIAGGAKNQR